MNQTDPISATSEMPQQPSGEISRLDEHPDASRVHVRPRKKAAAPKRNRSLTKANQALVPTLAPRSAFVNPGLRRIAYYADENVLVLNMDVRRAISYLARAGIAVNCMVTSPPFYGAYSAQRERGFHAIVNARWVSAAEAADMGSGVHDPIGDGRFPAMTRSDSRPSTPRIIFATSVPL
jgi:hypothetical protein